MKKTGDNNKVVGIIAITLFVLIIIAFIGISKFGNTKVNIEDANSNIMKDTKVSGENESIDLKNSKEKEYAKIQEEIRQVTQQGVDGKLSQKEVRKRLAELQQEALKLQMSN